MADNTLAEIPESAATGTVAEIYRDIRATLSAPAVNLIFRHLATLDGCLEWAWSVLRPHYRAGRLRAAARRLLAEATPPALGRPGVDLTADDVAGLRATLGFYLDANPINLIGMQLLLRRLDGATHAQLGMAELPAIPPPPAVIPKMRELADMPRALAEIVRELSREATGGDTVIPSLYRHLANWPEFLRWAAPELRRALADGALAIAAQRMIAQGAAIAAELASSAPPPPEGEAGAKLRRYVRTTPEVIAPMTVIALALDRAVERAPTPRL